MTMNKTNSNPEINPEITPNAVSVYGQDDALDDFPVLKAFQRYIDSEQSKARKRMLGLAAFFGLMMCIVIAVFVMMLMNISERNQLLNDRLIDYAMKDRERLPAGAASPVVVQPPQDSAAILALTAKLDELQKKLASDQAKAEKIAAEAAAKAEKAAAEAAAKAEKAAAEAAKPKGPSPAELEIEKLRALLAAEKEKAAKEREKQREAELEAYRRRHYPEFYERHKGKSPSRPAVNGGSKKNIPVDDEEIDDILDEANAVSYFDEEDDEDVKPPRKTAKTIAPKPKEKPAAKSPQLTDTPAAQPKKNEYTIPVDVKGKTSSWSIPVD